MWFGCVASRRMLITVVFARSPPAQFLEKFRKHSSHIDFTTFRESKGTGIARMLPHVSKEGVDLIEKLLIYDPDERYVRGALLHGLRGETFGVCR